MPPFFIRNLRNLHFDEQNGITFFVSVAGVFSFLASLLQRLFGLHGRFRFSRGFGHECRHLSDAWFCRVNALFNWRFYLLSLKALPTFAIPIQSDFIFSSGGKIKCLTS